MKVLFAFFVCIGLVGAQETPAARHELLSQEADLEREVDQYQFILNMISERRYEPASKALSALLSKSKVPEIKTLCHYWLGEIFFHKKDFLAAAKSYGAAYQYVQKKSEPSKLLSVFSLLRLEQVRLKEVLLKLSFSLHKLGKNRDAKLALAEFNTKDKTLTKAQKQLHAQILRALR